RIATRSHSRRGTPAWPLPLRWSLGRSGWSCAILLRCWNAGADRRASGCQGSLAVGRQLGRVFLGGTVGNVPGAAEGADQADVGGEATGLQVEQGLLRLQQCGL